MGNMVAIMGVRPRAIIGALIRIPAWLLIRAARAYQWLMSPLLGQRCRFVPTCSEYFIESVRKYGAIRGTWRGGLRILRCHPWHPGGYDPP
jgi:putative membrane protein insertion efficiency factor